MACNGDTYNDHQSIPELAKMQIKELFSDTKPSQWCTLVPNDEQSLECKPSDSSKHYTKNPGGEEDVRCYLHRSFEQIFSERGHVETFWMDFSMDVTHKLGLTYREAHKLNGTASSYSEVKLRHCILHPILKEVSKATCIIPDIKDETIKIDYLIEDEIELEEGKQGQKPAVDAVIQVSNMRDKVIALVPIEMKLDIETKHYSQIACYMNKLSTAEDIRDSVMVGIIVDKKQFRLAFSVFRDQDVPLPIVHISPPTAWRSESSGIVYEQSMLVLVCTFLIGQTQRLQHDPKKHYPYKSLTAMGTILMRSPHDLTKLQRNITIPVKRRLDEQEKKIEQLQKMVESLQKSAAEKPKTKKHKK